MSAPRLFAYSVLRLSQDKARRLFAGTVTVMM
jgi:hypothetical protein